MPAQSYNCLVTNPVPYVRQVEVGAVHTEVVVLIPVTRGLFDVFLGDDRLGECEEADLRAFLKERGVESSTPKLIEKPDGGLKVYKYPAPKSGKKKSNAKKKTAKKKTAKKRTSSKKRNPSKKKAAKKKVSKKKNPSKKKAAKKKVAKKKVSKKNPKKRTKKKATKRKSTKKKATKKRTSAKKKTTKRKSTRRKKNAAPRKEKEPLTAAQIDRALRNSGFNI